jgi:hypothetical protein
MARQNPVVRTARGAGPGKRPVTAGKKTVTKKQAMKMVKSTGKSIFYYPHTMKKKMMMLIIVP